VEKLLIALLIFTALVIFIPNADPGVLLLIALGISMFFINNKQLAKLEKAEQDHLKHEQAERREAMRRK
jgi:hypothetical protein